MLNQVHNVTEDDLHLEIRRIAVTGDEKIFAEDGQAGRDIDVWDVVDPLQRPLLLRVKALVQRGLLEFVSKGYEAGALFSGGRASLRLVLGLRGCRQTQGEH